MSTLAGSARSLPCEIRRSKPTHPNAAKCPGVRDLGNTLGTESFAPLSAASHSVSPPHCNDRPRRVAILPRWQNTAGRYSKSEWKSLYALAGPLDALKVVSRWGSRPV